MGIDSKTGRCAGVSGVLTGARLRLAGLAFPAWIRGLWPRRETVQPVGRITIVDETAFRTFYERTAPGLRSYLRLMSRDAALADDLLQESYFRFLRAGAPDLNEFQMKAYLYKTAASVTRDHWRKLKREQRLLEDLPLAGMAGRPNLSPDVERLFQALGSRQQALLWLAYVEGFRHDEIAETLGLREKSVRVLLLRARRELAGVLTKAGLSPEGKA